MEALVLVTSTFCPETLWLEHIPKWEPSFPDFQPEGIWTLTCHNPKGVPYPPGCRIAQVRVLFTPPGETGPLRSCGESRHSGESLGCGLCSKDSWFHVRKSLVKNKNSPGIRDWDSRKNQAYEAIKSYCVWLALFVGPGLLCFGLHCGSALMGKG